MLFYLINEYDYIMLCVKLLKKRIFYIYKKMLKCVNMLFNDGYFCLFGCFKDDVYLIWNIYMIKLWI